MASQQWQRTPKSVRRRASLWPPVGPIAAPAMNRRGPGMSACSSAVFMPQSAPPVSRTVVKPRLSMASISRAARAVISVSGTASRKRMFTSLSITCTWLSIRPGISVRPPQSITAAPADLIGLSDVSLTVSPSTSSSKPPCSSPTSGSSNWKFRNRNCVIVALRGVSIGQRHAERHKRFARAFRSLKDCGSSSASSRGRCSSCGVADCRTRLRAPATPARTATPLLADGSVSRGTEGRRRGARSRASLPP